MPSVPREMWSKFYDFFQRVTCSNVSMTSEGPAVQSSGAEVEFRTPPLYSDEELSLFPISELPESCIALVLSFLPPRDIVRLSLVNRSWALAAASDTAWSPVLHDAIPLPLISEIKGGSLPARMYHPDSEYIIRGEHLKSDMLLCKELCGGGLLVREGKQLVAIDPRTGKTKLSISAALSMSITWGDHPQYWNIEDPVEGSPFEAVAQLRHVWWFDVRADNIICMLPPGRYSAAWRLSCNGYITWQPEPVVSTIALAGEEEQRGAINVLEGMPELPEWLEWKFAEIEVGPQGPGGSGRGRGSSEGIDCRLNVQLKDYSNCYKTGLLVDSLVLAQIS